jgi:aspartate/methionine/tyrosine aminotransferase
MSENACQFDPTNIDLKVLAQRAHNLRWAELPAGVIPLTAADPDFPAAEVITEAIARYTSSNYYSYSAAKGYLPFREAMAAYMQTRRSYSVGVEGVLPVDSAAFGIYLTCKTLLNKGDEAIVFDPVDFLFAYSVEAVGGVAVRFPIPAGTDRVDFDSMESLLTPRTKLICLCNPLNPTGKVFTREELLQLAAFAEKHNLYILSDEIWSDIVFQPYSFTSIASLDKAVADRTITVTGFSKSYGLAGMRLGAVMATDPVLFERLFENSLHSTTIHGVNILAQVAGTAALNEAQDWLAGFIQHLQRMRDLTVSRMNAIPGFHCLSPQGCYVALVDVWGTGLSSADLQARLLKEAKVAVVPGLERWFGPAAAGTIRISFATTEEILTTAFDRIEKNIAGLCAS